MVLHVGDSILKYVVSPNKGQQPLGNGDCPGEELHSQLKKLFLHHLLQLRCNPHIVSEIMTVPEVNPDSKQSVGAESRAAGEFVDAVREVGLGTVLFPTASLMNHSCSPNAFFR